MNVLDSATTADILATVGQAHRDEDQPATPAPTSDRSSAGTIEAVTRPSSYDVSPVPIADDGQRPQRPASSTEQARLQLVVLGRPELTVVSGGHVEQLHVRRTGGMQILIHLAVHRHGASSDELMAALWPEARPTHSRARFHTTVSALRKVLREATGAMPIPLAGERYYLDTDLFSVDLWHLADVVERASTALDPVAHIAALNETISLYRGTIAEADSWLWLIPYREQLRRHVLDAYVALAETTDKPHVALGHVQDAIRLDPYNEDVYRRAMLLHAKLGSLDGIRRTLRALSERLAELGVRVSPQTHQVATDLAARLNAGQRPPDSPPESF
jgi:DNA-binding SARP family transcriptional activator